MHHLLSNLSHVELYTPKPDATLWYFKDLLGMEETAREGQSVYLRCWGDWMHHTLKITEAPQAGLAHVAWRAESAEDLELAAKAIAAKGLGQGWIEGDLGHGRAYRFADPDGHQMELVWEVERAVIPAALKTNHRARPQKYTGRGAGVRRLDHVNLLSGDPVAVREFLMDTLKFRYREGLHMDENELEMGSWLAVTSQMHDIALIRDTPGNSGRLHHVALWQDSPDGLMRTADILRDHDIFIEAGPARHGISDAMFMYTYEPGGNRVEIFNGGYLQHEPDWEPIIWHMSEFRYAAVWWGEALPPSFFSYGTPSVEVAEPVLA